MMPAKPGTTDRVTTKPTEPALTQYDCCSWQSKECSVHSICGNASTTNAFRTTSPLLSKHLPRSATPTLLVDVAPAGLCDDTHSAALREELLQRRVDRVGHAPQVNVPGLIKVPAAEAAADVQQVHAEPEGGADVKHAASQGDSCGEGACRGEPMWL